MVWLGGGRWGRWFIFWGFIFAYYIMTRIILYIYILLLFSYFWREKIGLIIPFFISRFFS